MALETVKLKNLDTGEEIKAQFNPAELAMSKGAQFAEIPIPGLDSPILQFIRGASETMSIELFFDGTDSGMGEDAKGTITQGIRSVASEETVDKKVEKLYRLVKINPKTHAPPVCELSWGDLTLGVTADTVLKTFQCVIQSVERRYLLFSPNGVPLRARVALSLKEYRTIAEQIDQLKLSSPDRTHIHVIRRGDRLDKIATQFYGDPGQWRRIAEKNRIDDPLGLTPGTVLTIPPILSV